MLRISYIIFKFKITVLLTLPFKAANGPET